MKFAHALSQAPRPVQFAGLVWLILGIGAIIVSIHSLVTFFSLPVTGMTWMVIAEASLYFAVATLVVLAAWKLLSGTAWGRTVLEFFSWFSVVYYVVAGTIWVGSAVLSWQEFKISVADQLPGTSPVLKLIAGLVVPAVFVIVAVAVLKALRSPETRQYVVKALNGSE